MSKSFKNLLKISLEETYELDELVIYAPKTDKAYIPREATRLIMKLSK